MAEKCIGERILDVGFSQSPNPYIQSKELYGLDLQKSSPSPNYTKTFIGDAHDLPKPFDDSFFDTVVAGEILEHVENPIALLRAFRRALREGGKLVLSTPNPSSPPELICNFFLNTSILYTEEHITLYPQRWLLRLMTKAGFRSVTLSSGGIQFPFIGSGKFPSFGLIPCPRAFCYQTIAEAYR
jgi:SAM-dependent methyltransferase